MKQMRLPPIWIALGLAALVAGYHFREVFSRSWAFFSDPEQIRQAVQAAGPWGWLVLVLLLILQVFLAFIPGHILMASAGYLYGLWMGILLGWLGLALGGQMAFWLARRFGRPLVIRFVAPALLERWQAFSARQGVLFYTISLILPIFPNDAMCYVAGLSDIPARKFLLANLCGRFIASSVLAALGAYGAEFSPGVWASLAAAVILVMLFWKFFGERFFRLKAKTPPA